MRKSPLFSAVLSLFLLVPASITRAQVTKKINGTVSYRSGMYETKFSTPNGDINVSLPQSLTGSAISGTVITEPAGKTEKEKGRNLKELMKLVVNLDGQKISPSSSPSNFDWVTHPDKLTRTPMELIDASGNKIAEVSLPAVISAPAILNPAISHISTPSNVLVKGDMLNVYTNGQFMPGEKFIVTDAGGKQFTIKPLVISANQAVINIPADAALGSLQVMEEGKNNSRPEKINLVDISLSSPNTNLRPGQKSYVEVALNTGKTAGQSSSFATIDPKITDKDSAEAMQIPVMSIDLRNLNPNTVTMQGGNLQRVGTNYFRSKLTEGEAARIEFQLRRDITGNAVGNFEVSATLHEDYRNSNDPFRPQLNVLNTVADFNAWVEALKKDLVQFCECGTDNEVCCSGQLACVTRVIKNIPFCSRPEQLDESKAVAYSLLKSLNVPKGAAINWQSSYEALKAALNAIGSNDILTDFDVLKNGTEFVNRVGHHTNDPALQRETANLQQQIDRVQTNPGSKENLQQLKDGINKLTAIADPKVKTGIPASTMKELAKASFQLPSLAQPGMVHPFNDLVAYMDTRKGKLLVVPEYKNAILNMIGAQPMPNGNYKIIPFGNNQNPSGFEIAIQYIDQFDLFKAANDGNNINLKLKPIAINFPGQGPTQPVANGGTISWETATDGGVTWSPDDSTPSVPHFINVWDPNYFGNIDSLQTEVLKGFSYEPLDDAPPEMENQKFTGWWVSTPGFSTPGIPDALPYPKDADKTKPWSWMIQDDIDWKGFDLPQLTPAGDGELKPIKPGDGTKDEIPFPKDKDRYRWEIGLIPVKPTPGTEPSPEKLKEFAEAFKKLFGPGAKPIIPNPLGYYYPVFIAKPKTTGNSTVPQPFFVALPEANNKSVDSKYGLPWNDPGSYKWILFLPPKYPNGRMQIPSFFFPPKDFFKDVYFEVKDEPEYLKPDSEFTDSVGTKYKFYKDAECVKISEPTEKNSSECRPEEKYKWDKDGKGGFVPTGRYFKIETVGSSWCKKGKGFCVEMEQVTAIVSIYEDKNCTRMIDVEKIMGFKCQ